jgi:hypothetical protein
VPAFFNPQPAWFPETSERNRRELASPPFHPLEAALIGVTAAHLCFLPWALGSMHRWSQLASLGFSITGFVLSLLPRAGRASDYSPAGRLWKFPVFWAGLLFLLYIAVQGLNPSWRYQSNADSWWLEPVAHIAWLPSSVQAPFARSNPWSALAIFGSLWLLVCSVWTGLTRRRSYRLLFTVLVSNAFLLALLGVMQQLTEAKRIFWSYLPSNGNFVSSFIYRNHAGPYLNLMVALAVGLSLWHFNRSQRRHGKTNLAVAMFLVFAAVFVGIMVIFSYSRASIGVLLAFTLCLASALAVRRFWGQAGQSRRRQELILLFLALGGFFAVCFVSIRADKVWQRFASIAIDPINSTGFRSIGRQAAGDMLRDHWLYGWGAGCFRHGFPLYAQKYPLIYYSDQGTLRYWEHVHDDLLEFPIEFGVVGLIPLLSAFGFYIWQLVRLRFWQNGVSFSLVVGCALVACNAWLDFVFQNPAVLLTWCVLFVAAVRWIELDQPGSGRLGARFSRSGRSPANDENITAQSRQFPGGLTAFSRRPQRLIP